MSVAEGELLAGKYRVERVLARGGMGVVFAAIHTQLDQRVALKFLLPESEASELSRSRFLREARAAVRLRSEHVARVLDVGTAEEGAPYIVMEYLEGQDLASLVVERGPLPESEAVGYILQAAEAVAEAHALGIIHRDLKPANLFLTRRPDGSPCVKVLDFGISKALEGGASLGGGLTQSTGMVGTPHYMSPEQIRSSKSVDARSDIWAMGMILYELLTGVVAFPRETLAELCSAIILDPIPPLREVAPDVSIELERAIAHALAKAPEHRPQTLAELATLLAPFSPDGLLAAARIARVLKIGPELPSSQRIVTLASASDPVLVSSQEADRHIGSADTEHPPAEGPATPSPPISVRRITPEPRSTPDPSFRVTTADRLIELPRRPRRAVVLLAGGVLGLTLAAIGLAASSRGHAAPASSSAERSARPLASAAPPMPAPSAPVAPAERPSVADLAPAPSPVATTVASAQSPRPQPGVARPAAAKPAGPRPQSPNEDDFGPRR